MLFGRLMKDLDEWGEMRKGNAAIGMVMTAMVISISTIVSQGVASIIAAVFA